MKISTIQAIQLWDEICNPQGSESIISTPLASVLLSHGINPNLQCISLFNLLHDEDNKKRKQVSDIAQFLRDWADCLETDWKNKES